MPSSHPVLPKSFALPGRQLFDGATSIPGASHESFTTRFGDAFPNPHFLSSELGRTAVYDVPAPSGTAIRRVLMVHGLNTPAMGLLPLVKELQKLDPNTHIVLYDLWGHALSSTPMAPHSPQIMHLQMLQVLGYMKWTSAHLFGYSFGGSTVVTFTLDNPWMVESVTIAGPAGLLKLSDFDPRMQKLLLDGEGREQEAVDCIMDWLEGGPLVVPDDWKEKMTNGDAGAQALKKWEQDEHTGYPHSILSMFREGNVYERDEKFRALAGTTVKSFGLVGESDPVASKAQLIDLGFDQVEIVKGEGHDFVRTAVVETAKYVQEFWTRTT